MSYNNCCNLVRFIELTEWFKKVLIYCGDAIHRFLFYNPSLLRSLAIDKGIERAIKASARLKTRQFDYCSCTARFWNQERTSLFFSYLFSDKRLWCRILITRRDLKTSFCEIWSNSPIYYCPAKVFNWNVH